MTIHLYKDNPRLAPPAAYHLKKFLIIRLRSRYLQAKTMQLISVNPNYNCHD